MMVKTIELTRVDLLKTIAERKLQQDEIKSWLGLSINYMLDTPSSTGILTRRHDSEAFNPAIIPQYLYPMSGINNVLSYVGV